MIEIWKPIIGFEDIYAVSNMGRVKRLPPYERVLKPSMRSNGSPNAKKYAYVMLCRHSKYKTFTIHRLVAEHFLQKPIEASQQPHKITVNHKDLNPANNIATNLEWITQSENVLHFLNSPQGKIYKERMSGIIKNSSAHKAFIKRMKATKWAHNSSS